MKVTILGSGTVDPQPHRASAGYLIENSQEGSFLVDCGYGTVRNGVAFGHNMAALPAICLTHLHPDHTVDLVSLLFARKYAPGPWQERVPLKVFGPTGTRDFFEALYGAWPSIKASKDSEQVSITEIQQGDAFEPVAGVTVSAHSVVHGDMVAFSYRLQEEGTVVALSGDTRLCPGVKEAAKDADLFFCECSCFPRGCEPLYCREVHLSWEDVAEICEQALVKKVVLTHLYEVVLARKPGPADSLKERLEIPVELGADGAVYQL